MIVLTSASTRCASTLATALSKYGLPVTGFGCCWVGTTTLISSLALARAEQRIPRRRRERPAVLAQHAEVLGDDVSNRRAREPPAPVDVEQVVPVDEQLSTRRQHPPQSGKQSDQDGLRDVLNDLDDEDDVEGQVFVAVRRPKESMSVVDPGDARSQERPERRLRVAAHGRRTIDGPHPEPMPAEKRQGDPPHAATVVEDAYPVAHETEAVHHPQHLLRLSLPLPRQRTLCRARSGSSWSNSQR